MEIKDVDKLAELSRINLEESEKEEFRTSLDSILHYVEQVKQISSDTEIEERHFNLNNLREDVNPNPTGVNTRKLVDSAPQKDGDYVKVSKIL